jgi:Tfp pilus assembly protein PilO
MTAKLRNPKALAAAVLGTVVVVVAGAWLALVGPERSKANKLTGEIASVQTQIDQRKAALAAPKADIHVRASDVYRLTRAMPDAPDMAGIILVLNRVAGSHKLQFESLQPSGVVAQTGFSVQPLSVVVQGRFGDVSGFLGDLRKLVRVKKHALAATGRLFAVDSVNFTAPDSKKAFPNVKATLTVDAFMFTGGVLPTTPGTTPTTTSPASGTVAAGANP